MCAINSVSRKIQKHPLEWRLWHQYLFIYFIFWTKRNYGEIMPSAKMWYAVIFLYCSYLNCTFLFRRKNTAYPNISPQSLRYSQFLLLIFGHGFLVLDFNRHSSKFYSILTLIYCILAIGQTNLFEFRSLPPLDRHGVTVYFRGTKFEQTARGNIRSKCRARATNNALRDPRYTKPGEDDCSDNVRSFVQLIRTCHSNFEFSICHFR